MPGALAGQQRVLGGLRQGRRLVAERRPRQRRARGRRRSEAVRTGTAVAESSVSRETSAVRPACGELASSCGDSRSASACGPVDNSGQSPGVCSGHPLRLRPAGPSSITRPASASSCRTAVRHATRDGSAWATRTALVVDSPVPAPSSSSSGSAQRNRAQRRAGRLDLRPPATGPSSPAARRRAPPAASTRPAAGPAAPAPARSPRRTPAARAVPRRGRAPPRRGQAQGRRPPRPGTSCGAAAARPG